ncbi:MAG: 2-C-methyl-D-erythritol 4-phosphate cytidylyltransferase [Lentimonas sp.]|jgi:2-C-methyl-D-erythritol 4-phosphate cytidylyltransferase
MHTLRTVIKSDSVPSDPSSFASAIILAAGSGSRMRDSVADKTLALLDGLPVICHSIRAFVSSKCIQRFTIVYRDPAQKTALTAALKSIDLDGLPCDWVWGGKRRQDSVYKALLNQPENCSHVFIHDSARPLISSDSIRTLYSAVLRDQSAALAHPVTDTIKRIPNATDITQTPLEDLDRSRLWAIETPQAFELELILKAYEHVNETGLQITDDTAAIAAIGLGTTLVPNGTSNIKITTPDDLDYAGWQLLEHRTSNLEH